MTSWQGEGRPVVLSGLDLPDGHRLLIHGCEDCACAVSHDSASRVPNVPYFPAMADLNSWVCAREVVDIEIDPAHKALFNPVGRAGVVVVNESAYRIFSGFRRPTTFGDVRIRWPDNGEEVDQVSRRLGELELIHPAGMNRSVQFGDGEVLTAWLHVTNACNLRCPYCYVSKSAEKMDAAVGRAAVEAVVRSAVTNGFSAVKLKYAGGEASLNSQLMLELHAYARELTDAHGLKLYATLLSNGVRLSPALIERLKGEYVQIMISLDGLGGEHDVQRPFANGQPSFRHVEQTITQLIGRGHPPHLSITITNRNAGGVADTVRFALERDLTFSLNLFRDNDCASSFPDLQYEEQSIIAALLDAFGVIEEFLPKWSVLGSVLDRGQLLEPRQRSCGVGQDYVVIDQRGGVAKCHMEIERTLGDVFHDDPLQLVRRDQATILNLPVAEKEGCRDCTWRYWCSGGCSVATFRATGRYDIKSPNCNIYKAIYPRALRLEALRLLRYAASPY